MSDFKNNLVKLSVASLALGFATNAFAADAAEEAAKAAKEQIINLNANFNSFETNKDYENFIQSRSKLLQYNANDKLKDVDVNAQPEEENSVLIEKFSFVPDDGLYLPIIAKIEAEANKYVGQKFSARKMAALKNNLNNILIRAGYVTSIIYIPEDGFKDNALTQKIKWGRVNELRVSPETVETYKNDAMFLTVPRFSNGVLRIDTIDQLVENLTTVNKQVRVDVAAALNKSGYSDLVVSAFRTQKPAFGLTIGNANDKDQPQVTFSASAADLIGINDAWTLTYTKRLMKDMSDKNLDVVGLRYDQPLGFFNLSVNNSLIRFKNTQTTGNAKYVVRAPSFKTDWKLSYTAYRDKTSIVSVYAGFGVKHGHTDVRFAQEAPNFISFENKNTTDYRVGVNYLNKGFFGGTFFIDGTYTQGLGFFQGAKTADPDKTDPRLGGTDYAKTLSLYASYNRNFVFEHDWFKILNSSTTVTAQKSLSGRLIGYDTTYGDAYSVRGFRKYSFSGDDGFMLSTNLGPIFQLQNKYVNTVNPYVGLDFGMVSYPDYSEAYKAETAHGASFNVGTVISGPYYKASLNVGVPFGYEQNDVTKARVNNFETYFNVSFNF